MKRKSLLSAALCVMLLLPQTAVLHAEESESIIITGEEIYKEDFESGVKFAENTAYACAEDNSRGALAFDRIGHIDNMQSLAGAEAADVIAEFDMKLTNASGATNNSVFFTLRAQEAGGSGIKFAYHDISRYDAQTGGFGSNRIRDRISVGYSSGSDDMTNWSIGAISGAMGIENTGTRSFDDYYTFRAAAVGGMAYHQVFSSDGDLIEAVCADISAYDAPQKGRMYIGAHNCAAYIDEIRMYNAVKTAEVSIEAENMELSQGETTSFNIRIRDEEGVWHSLDKSRNSEFDFDYDSEKLIVDAQGGTITALADDELKLFVTAKDFYSGDTLTNEFVFESITDEAAAEAAKDALELNLTEVREDFELPLSGLYGTSVEWTSSNAAIRIYQGTAKVIAPEKDTVVTLTAKITRQEASAVKMFDITVKAAVAPLRDVILKGGLIYSESFDNLQSVDSDWKSIIDNETIIYEDGALHINSKGVVLSAAQFGPETSACIAEYDAKQLGCTANSNAQFSMGLMASGSSSYRFAYADVSAYNTATNTLNGPTGRDRIFLGHTSSSANMGNWTLYGAGKSPMGILNTSTRSFDDYYTFSAAAAGNTIQLALTDKASPVDSVSYYNPSMKLGSGRLQLNMQSTEFMLDNIRVYDAVGFREIALQTEKQAVKPGEEVPFEIIISGDTALDKSYYSMLEFDCDDGISVDVQNGTVTAEREGEFIVRVTARDYLDKSVAVYKAAVICASSYADKIEEIAGALDINDYIDYPDGIVKDFKLPSEFMQSAVTWSSDSSAIVINGTAAEISRGNEDIQATLTADITIGGISVSKSFTVTVLRSYSDEEAIELDMKLVSVPERTKENLDLPVEGRYGSAITWSSDNTSVISSGGTVKRAQKDVSVRLGAEFCIGSTIKKYYYNVIVEGTGTGASVGGGSGGSSGSGAGTPNISVSVANNQTQNIFRFDDVQSGFWGENAIYELVKAGVIARDTSFRPNDNITREEFVKLAVEAFGLYSEAAECDFDDVDRSAWYYRYVASGVNAGVISGISGSLFGTGELITRQDMAAIIARLLVNCGEELKAGESGFDDGELIADYAKDAVAALCSGGILSGMGDNRFEPLANATRAQAAVLLNRARK